MAVEESIQFSADMRLNTDKAVKDAKDLASQIKSTFEKIDMSRLGKGSSNLVQSIQRMQTELDKVVKSTEELGKMKMPTQEYQKLEAQAKQVNKEIELTKKTIEGLEAKGLQNTSTYRGKQSRLALLVERESGIHDQMRGMRDAGTAYTTGKESQVYKDSAQSINQMVQAINLLLQNLTQLHTQEQQTEEDAQRVSEAMSHVGDTMEVNERTVGSYASSVGNRLMPVVRRLGNAIARLWQGFRSLVSHMRRATQHNNSFSGSISRSFRNLLRYTLGISSILSLIRRGQGYVKEAFKVMAQEIPEVNQALSMLGTSFKEIKAGFGTMLQPLLQKFAPIIDMILQKILSLMNAIAKFFATLTGQNYIYEATVANYDYAESVKEAENSLASFDKLNVIGNKDKNDLSLTKDTVKYTRVDFEPDDNWFTQLAQKIKDGWANGNLEDAGATIAGKLAEMLDGISWDDIRSKTNKFSGMLATGINGLTIQDNENGHSSLAESIGKFIGEAIQTAITNIHTFVTTLDWSALGDFIGTSIDNLKTTLRNNQTWINVGETIGSLFQGLVEFGLELFVKHNIFEGIGKDLGDMLDAALKKGLEINPETGNTFLYDFGVTITEGITKLLTEIEDFLDSEGVQNRLPKAINELFQGIDLLEIFKHVAKVFIKGLFTGFKLVISAGLGALGFGFDGDIVGFIAEALGLMFLGDKILDLVKKITGSTTGTGGTGGLLGAFQKKDKALDTQKDKLGAEKDAVGKLGGAIGGLSTVALPVLIWSLANTNGALEGTKGKFNELTDASKESSGGIVKNYVNMWKDLIDAAKEFKLPEVDTTNLTNSLNDGLNSINSYMEAYQQALNRKLTGPEITNPTTGTGTGGNSTSKLSDNLTTTMLGWNLLQTSSGNISKYVASKMSGIFKKNKDDDDKKNKGGGAGGGGSTTKIKSIQGGKISAAAPYYELEQAGMKAEQERQAQVTAQNVSYFESVINALPSEELQAMYTEMFLDTAATFGYKNLEEVFTSPSATSAVWSQLMAQGNYDGVSAIIGNQDFYKQISNSKKVNEDDILTYFLRNFVPAFNGGSFASIAVPAFARGVVIPPNQPFLGILGDQKTGTNVETPLSTIEQAVANVLSKMGINLKLEIQGDSNRLFKAVQKEYKIYYNQTRNNAF